jgi:cellulose synthase/poly-beta-1,6-N-acetylglucosamine synthase-like glycosyltransferase
LEGLRISVVILQYLLLFFSAYWLFISLFSFGKPRKLRDKLPQKRFLLLVAAHNEANVIGQLLDNLNNLDYPRDMYEVCLIADHCDDDTAFIGREKGVTVLEHWYSIGEPRGKPYALKYAIEKYRDRLGTDFDAVCIFDADNLVSLNYLKEMNNHLLNGEKLIQCYLDSKNPDDNWITLGYASSYYYMNRTWQLGKYRLKLGNAIGGTGFCVDATLLKEVGWNAKSLTEDLEFTIQCLLRGVYATWAHHARVYDEKPTSFKASLIQRLRWARGHWDVCFRYVHRLLWRAITRADIRALDGAIYLINPGKIVVSFLISMMLHISFILQYFGISAGIGKYILPWWVWLVTLSFNFILLLYSRNADVPHKNKRSNIFYMAYSLFMLNAIYVILFFIGIATAHKKTWKRTEHKRNLSISDVVGETVNT